MPAALDECLNRFLLVQPFSKVHHLNFEDSIFFSQPSLASLGAGAGLAQIMLRQQASPSAGFMWAARRDFIQEHGFYDVCVIGGGDSALACAAYGEFERVMNFHFMNEWQRRYYLAWAERIYRNVQGKVGYLDVAIRHLWHGSMRDRHSQRRHKDLSAFSFNPYEDIRRERAWLWNTEKPELHRYMKDYFALRNEDALNDSPLRVPLNQPI